MLYGLCNASFYHTPFFITQLIVNQGQGKGKEVEREEDGEMSSGFLQKQHERELHKIEMNDVYMRRATSYDTG